MLKAVVSYRSVPRILNLFNVSKQLELEWIPHFTSVINWTLRLGLGLLKQIKPISRPWLAIIDHSIDIGTKKALVVLRLPIDTLSRKGEAIQLKDCECIGLIISETVNGKTISIQLEEIFTKAGLPAAIIKDCDATLQKGVSLWADKLGIVIPVIEDIGHVLANALKKQFEKTKDYKRFVSLLKHGANCLRQTNLAFLIPPKLRNKGRFQSVSKLGKWGEKMLEKIAVKGRAKNGSVLARFRTAMPGFVSLRPFIVRFAETTKITSSVMKILKNKGLNLNSYDQCVQLSNELPVNSVVKTRLQSWLKNHLEIQQQLTHLPLLVSSDIIESLFGNFKHIIERSPQADMNRSVLVIPALCGNIDASVITQTFPHARHKDLKDWEIENIPYTLRKKRQAYFST